MQVTFRCDCCGHLQAVDEYLVGKLVQCPKCDSIGVMPSNGKIYGLDGGSAGASSRPSPQSRTAHNVAYTPASSHPGYHEADELAPEPSYSPSAPTQPAYQGPFGALPASSAPQSGPFENRPKFSHRVMNLLASTPILATAFASSVLFSRTVSHGDCGVYPVGTVVAISAMSLGVFASIWRYKTQKGSMLFPVILTMVAALMIARAQNNYKREVRINDYYGYHDRSQQDVASTFSMRYRGTSARLTAEYGYEGGTIDRDFDQQRLPSYDWSQPLGPAEDEAMRRSPQSWWPTAKLHELPLDAVERMRLIAAANVVLEESPMVSEGGKTASLVLPPSDSALRYDLREAGGSLEQVFIPRQGGWNLRYVKMWPNTFRVLHYPAGSNGGKNWSGAVQVTLTDSGEYQFEFFTTKAPTTKARTTEKSDEQSEKKTSMPLAPKASLPKATNPKSSPND